MNIHSNGSSGKTPNYHFDEISHMHRWAIPSSYMHTMMVYSSPRSMSNSTILCTSSEWILWRQYIYIYLRPQVTKIFCCFYANTICAHASRPCIIRNLIKFTLLYAKRLDGCSVAAPSYICSFRVLHMSLSLTRFPWSWWCCASSYIVLCRV